MGEANKHNLNARLREHILQRGFRTGELLPGERALAADLGVGRTALRPVLDALEREGVLERRPQAGTFLRSVPEPHVRSARVTLIAPVGPTGVANPETDPVWLHRVVSALERVAIPAGARLQLLDQSAHSANPGSVKDLAREAAAAGARAVVFIHPLGTRETIACALALLHDLGVHPLIASARTYPGLASQVYFDSSWGAYVATRHLLQLGHRRIGFAAAPSGHEWVRERIAGYTQALDTAEVGAAERWIWQPAGTERLPLPEDGAEALAHWVQLPAGKRATGIVAANDVVALGLLEAARQRGVAIPGDLALVGFDNDPGALLAGLTTIERPTEALGEAAARVTLERLAAGPEAAAVTHRLRPVLIKRQTSGAPVLPEEKTR